MEGCWGVSGVKAWSQERGAYRQRSQRENGFCWSDVVATDMKMCETTTSWQKILSKISSPTWPKMQSLLGCVLVSLSQMGKKTSEKESKQPWRWWCPSRGRDPRDVNGSLLGGSSYEKRRFNVLILKSFLKFDAIPIILKWIELRCRTSNHHQKGHYTREHGFPAWWPQAEKAAKTTPEVKAASKLGKDVWFGSTPDPGCQSPPGLHF